MAVYNRELCVSEGWRRRMRRSRGTTCTHECYPGYQSAMKLTSKEDY